MVSAIVVRRPLSGAYDDHGRWQTRQSVDLAISASVQPATPKDLEDVDEDRRTRENIRLYTQTELLTASVSESQQPDVVVWEDVDYEVHSVTNWGEVGNYYKVLAVKVGQ